MALDGKALVRGERRQTQSFSSTAQRMEMSQCWDWKEIKTTLLCLSSAAAKQCLTLRAKEHSCTNVSLCGNVQIILYNTSFQQTGRGAALCPYRRDSESSESSK